MDDLGTERVHGRPIKFFELAGWNWEDPRVVSPFTLFVAAAAQETDERLIRQFAEDAVSSGCAYVCTWGEGCELVHDLFDEVSIAADRLVMSTWHASEPLHDALYFALVNGWYDGMPGTGAPVILAVEPSWAGAVRGLVADQDELARLWIADEK